MGKLGRFRLAWLMVLLTLTGGAALTSGASAAAVDNHITLVSVGNPDVVGANGSLAQDISADGRYVVFLSQQPNLVPGQTADGGRYVYLRDLATSTTTRVGPAGNRLGYATGNVSISADGRFVSYGAQPSASASGRLYRYDATTGVNTEISLPRAAGERPSTWFKSDISADGRYVIYLRSSSTDDVSYVRHLFRYDATTGQTRQLLTRDVGGIRDTPNYFSTPSVSSTGRYVAFVQAMDPTLEQPAYQLVRLDTSDGSTRTIATSSPQYNIDSAFSGPSISANGRLVAYGDEGLDVRVYDATSGASTLVSRNAAGQPGNGDSTKPALSGSGRYVTYTSSATDIATGPLGAATVLLHDRTSGTTRAIVTNRQGVYSDNLGATSSFSVVSSNGRTVAFTSNIRGLAPNTASSIERTFVWRG